MQKSPLTLTLTLSPEDGGEGTTPWHLEAITLSDRSSMTTNS